MRNLYRVLATISLLVGLSFSAHASGKPHTTRHNEPSALIAITGELGPAIADKAAVALQWTFDGAATVYDQSMDWEYIKSGFEFGPEHRYFDGSHDLSGAWEAVKRALPNDTRLEELTGGMKAITKDLFTEKGMPLLSLDKLRFERFTDTLQNYAPVSRGWLLDMNSVNGSELLGAAVCIIPAATANTEGSAACLASSIATGNPVGVAVSTVGVVRGCAKHVRNAHAIKCAKGLAVGGVVAVVVASVAASGAPILVIVPAAMLTRYAAVKSWQFAQSEDFRNWAHRTAKAPVYWTRRAYSGSRDTVAHYWEKNTSDGVKGFARHTWNAPEYWSKRAYTAATQWW